MSAQRRRAGGPIRQLSLQPPQSATRRPPLRKQSSEDIWDSGNDGGLRILANAIHSPTIQTNRSTCQPTVRPRPVKLAWTERRTASPARQDHSEIQVEVVARRCKGLPRPATAKPPTQETLNQSSNRLAERLRLAWQQRHPTRTNLDIFLAHNSVIDRPNGYTDQPQQKEVTLDLVESVSGSVEEADSRAKICGSTEKKIEESSSGESSEESELSDQECERVVENNKGMSVEEKTDVLMRKTTVNSNLKNFKSSEGQSPPPPRRLMSAPAARPRTATPTPQPSEKPPPPRRRLKTVRRRPHRADEEISSGEDIEQKPRRSRSARTSEVVTMVSLLSPGHSEHEDEEEEPALQPLLNSTVQSLTWEDRLLPTTNQPNLTTNTSSTTTRVVNTSTATATTPAIVCIRKPVKMVSFQHNGSNSSRSYANNFPLRRGAAAPPDDNLADMPTTPHVPALKRKLFSRIKSNTVTGSGPIL